MNYNDQILENKAFNFFKQLMYNIALSICIMLVGVLVMMYVFKYKLYNVLSDSEAPYFTKGDMVIVKAKKDYVVGDIVKFDDNGTPVTHRLISIIEEGGKKYYICHGDNNQNLDDTKADGKWKDDAEYIKNLGGNLSQIQADCGVLIQTVTLDKIEGKVVGSLNNYGTYIQFIKDHYMLFISIVAGIWCISSVIQNEIEIKKTRRLV